MSVPARPVFRDGAVVLRPQTLEDVDAARLQRDQEVAHLVVRLLVEHRTREAGTAEIRLTGHGSAELSWAVAGQDRGKGIGTQAVQLLVRYAFEELGLHRVVAYVEPDDRVSLRMCGRAGLRREGFVRSARATGSGVGHGGERRSFVQLARLADDPEPTSGGGFIPVLNAGLPTKRVIAQGLIRNSANEILLCELTYKKEWDLPGGVVDPHESPAHALVREIREEMQVEMRPGALRAVNWLPPWRGWDDAMLFVFDLGADDDVIARSRLEPREIQALHWCTLERVERHAAPYVSRMLRLLDLQGEGTAYLEDGAYPG